MINLYYQIPIAGEIDTIWNYLIDKVEQPQKYIPGVSQFHFEPLEDGRRLRIMQRNGIEVKEIITVDSSEKYTNFELQGHPRYSGFIENKIIRRGGRAFLTYLLRWEAHNGEEDFEATKEWMDNVVDKFIEFSA